MQGLMQNRGGSSVSPYETQQQNRESMRTTLLCQMSDLTQLGQEIEATEALLSRLNNTDLPKGDNSAIWRASQMLHSHVATLWSGRDRIQAATREFTSALLPYEVGKRSWEMYPIYRAYIEGPRTTADLLLEDAGARKLTYLLWERAQELETTQCARLYLSGSVYEDFHQALTDERLTEAKLDYHMIKFDDIMKGRQIYNTCSRALPGRWAPRSDASDGLNLYQKFGSSVMEGEDPVNAYVAAAMDLRENLEGPNAPWSGADEKKIRDRTGSYLSAVRWTQGGTGALVYNVWLVACKDTTIPDGLRERCEEVSSDGGAIIVVP